MMSSATERIVIPLSPAQQDVIRSFSGVRKREVILTRLELAALVLAADRAGRDVLPVARSPEMRARMLQERDAQPDGTDVLTLLLTEEQRRIINEVTQRAPSLLKLAASEFRVMYRETWAERSRPQLIGARYVILPADAEDSHPGRDLVIRLPHDEESAAHGVFGTGAHETTQLPLLLMEVHVRNPARVLDLGTGSGILAVAAARLGAQHVLGLDIDAQAIAMARTTVSLNSLDGTIEVRVGGIDAAHPPYDLVIANIYANVLAPLAPALAAGITTTGMLIVSGVPSTMAATILDAFHQAGLQPHARRDMNQWTAFLFGARP